MSLHTKVCLVVVGTFLASLLVQNECRKLDGYKFPVYSTAFCPRNDSEWIERSSALNCNKSNGYTCLPNENFDQLLEYCYIVPVERIQKGFCLYLVKRASRTQSYSCRNFAQGCHNHSFFSNEIYKYQACISLGKGCFLAEPSCKSIQSTAEQFENVSVNEWNRSTTTHPQQSSELPDLDNTTNNDNDGALFAAILLGIFILLCILSLLPAYYIKRIHRRKDDEELDETDENGPLLGDKIHSANGTDCGHEEEECTQSVDKEKEKINQESRMEKAIFDQWKQDDFCFISTNACEKVKRIIESRNLIIVGGHSGSGKSAIIQHIALIYREQGWTVIQVKEVKNIVDVYSSSRFQENKTICVFNDPLGKESFDEILNTSWQTYKGELEIYLKTAKLVMSCRSHIISDTRLIRYLANEKNIVKIDDSINKLSVEEKRQILMKYTSNMNLSKTDCSEIVKEERYFPLLCKLYSSEGEKINKGVNFFKNPEAVLKEEIKGFRNKDMGKYCALALLVLFSNDLCVSDLLKNEDTENKFNHTLRLCGLPKETPPSAIADSLNSMKDFFVKKVGEAYHFYHDFIMEVTTCVFGNDYPRETIMYADIGFLRKRVKLGNCDEHGDSFTIYLSDKYIEELGERLYTELYGECLVDVVLNPCLRNENVIEVLKKKIAGHSENLYMLLKTKKLTIDTQKLNWTSKTGLMNKLEFLELRNEVSPLFALIVLCHTQLSLYCLKFLKQKHTDFNSCFFAVCCNGSTELLNYFCKDHAKKSFTKTLGNLYPIHIVSLFHNYDLLNKFIKEGEDVDKFDDCNIWTPLMLAAGNDIRENEDFNHRETGATRRDTTVQLLLSNGAGINLCAEDGASPLYIACRNGHNSTVQLLLSNGADINLCKEDVASPLYAACLNGHESTVQLLLSKGADINLCDKSGSCPLTAACLNGHERTVQLLLSNGADINLCAEDGASPLTAACFIGDNSTVQLLLRNGADINLCNICFMDGISPLYMACLFRNKGTIQLLLSNGADINLCTKDRISPLIYAFENRHYETVNILLNNGADTSLACGWEVNPALFDCFDKQDCTVIFLLQKDNISNNLYDPDSYFSLFVSCQVERVRRTREF